jgi:predicted outer membrane protein
MRSRFRRRSTRQTREFVQASAQSDTFEILEASSVLALSKNLQTRSFAQRMIESHSQSRDRLMAIVQQKGLSLPAPGIGNDQSQFLAALQSQHGDSVDRTYVRQQSFAHRAALATVQGYVASGDNEALRAKATSDQALISDHLHMADALAQSQPED